MTGLTITFGQTAWLINVVHWIESSVVITSDKGFAIRGVLGIFRDFSVTFGIGFVMVANSIAILRGGENVPRFNSVSRWASLLLPCVCLSSGLTMAFHYPFPSHLLIFDDQLAIIADASEEQSFRSRSFLFRNWLWTYWFALIGYAAIVFAFFYAAISGFRLFANENRDSDTDETPINPAASTLHRSS